MSQISMIERNVVNFTLPIELNGKAIMAIHWQARKEPSHCETLLNCLNNLWDSVRHVQHAYTHATDQGRCVRCVRFCEIELGSVRLTRVVEGVSKIRSWCILGQLGES